MKPLPFGRALPILVRQLPGGHKSIPLLCPVEVNLPVHPPEWSMPISHTEVYPAQCPVGEPSLLLRGD